MKQTLIFIALIFSLSYCYSQNFKWASSNGGFVDNIIFCSQIDSENEVFIAGNGSIKEFGWNNLFVAKTDSAGKLIWVFETEFSDNALPTDLVIDKNGDIIITGYYTALNFDTIILTPSVQPRMFLAKFNNEGKIKWAKDFGSLNSTISSYCNAVDVDKNNNIYVTGNFLRDMSFDSITILNSNPESIFECDIFVSSFNENGSALWAKNYGSKGEDWAYDLKIVDDNLYIAGSFSTFKPFFDTITPVVENVYLTGYIADLNLNGSVNWVNTGKTPSWSYGEIVDLATDSKGNVYGFGQYEGSVVFNSDTISDSEKVIGVGALVKIDSLGNSIWAKKINTSPYEFFSNYLTGTIYRVSGEIECDKNDNLILASSYENYLSIDKDIIFSNDPLPNSTPRNIFIAKFNEIGYPQWYRRAGNDGKDYVTSLSIAESGQILMGGIFSSQSLVLDTTTISKKFQHTNFDSYITTIIDTTENICPLMDSHILTAQDHICEGSPLIMTCMSDYGNSYLLFRNGTEFSYNYRKSISLNEEGDYQYFINPGLVCQDTTNIKSITKRNKPEVNLEAFPDSIICSSDSVQLIASVSEDYLYSWLKEDSLLNESISNISYVKEKGDYIVSVYDGFCFNSDSLSIISGLPSLLLKSHFKTLCNDKKIFLSADYFEDYSYIWQLNDSIVDTVNYHIASLPGVYTLSVSNQYCTLSDSTEIIAGLLPDAEILEDTITTETLPVLITSNGNPANLYSWIFGNETNTIGWTNSLYADKPGMYRIVSSTPCGTVSDTVFVVYNDTVSVTEYIENPDISIYPNPSSGIINLSLSGKENDCQLIRIFNGEGKIVMTQTINKGQDKKILDLSSFSPGLYFIGFYYNEREILKKVMLK